MVFVKTIAAALVTVTLAACGSDNGDVATIVSDDGVTNNQDVSATRDIAGLWDFTEDEGNEGVDVLYVLIDTDGTGVLYDYQGDTFDRGDNCYLLVDSPVDSLGNNQFKSMFIRVGEFTATSDEDTLTITDSEGTETYTLVENLSIIDFNQCE